MRGSIVEEGRGALNHQAPDFEEQFHREAW